MSNSTTSVTIPEDWIASILRSSVTLCLLLFAFGLLRLSEYENFNQLWPRYFGRHCIHIR